MRLPFHVREPQQRAIARLQFREDLRHVRIVFVARRIRHGLRHHILALFVSAAAPSVHDEIARHTIQIPPQVFFGLRGHIGAQHAQECFLDDIVGVGGVADDTIDIRAKRA